MFRRHVDAYYPILNQKSKVGLLVHELLKK